MECYPQCYRFVLEEQLLSQAPQPGICCGQMVVWCVSNLHVKKPHCASRTYSRISDYCTLYKARYNSFPNLSSGYALGILGGPSGIARNSGGPSVQKRKIPKQLLPLWICPPKNTSHCVRLCHRLQKNRRTGQLYSNEWTRGFFATTSSFMVYRCTVIRPSIG
jgi:hypothetical protein